MVNRFVFVSLSLVVCAACLVSCGRQSEVPEAADVTALAQEFVEQLSDRDFPAAAGSFDNTMAQAMPPDKLEEAWGSLAANMGAFKRQVGVRTAREQGFDVAYVTCEFERGRMDVKLVFDRSRNISGLWFVPPT